MFTSRRLLLIGATAVLGIALAALPRFDAAANPAQSFCTNTPSGPCPAGATAVDWDVCYDLGLNTTISQAGGIAPGDTTVTVASTAGFPAPGAIQIESEAILYSGITATSFTGLTRGYNGTSLAAHADTTAIRNYGQPRGPGLSCAPGTSDSAIPLGVAGVPVRQWHLTRIPSGSRPGLPITYTPGDWQYVAPAPGAVTGSVTAETDVFCDSGPSDILSSATLPPPGGSPSWPGNGWTPFDLKSQTIPPTGDNAYVAQFQPMPSTFTYKALERGDLTQIWLGGTFGPQFIPPTTGAHPGTPLQNLYTNSPYVPGLEASVTVLGADLNPPDNQFICRDTPQNSVVQYNQTVPPTTLGNYVRWIAITSSPDPIDGTVTRVLDTRCVNVGGAAGTCDLSDADNDLVPHDVEIAIGTDPNNADSDSDGATDYDEIFQFTNPLVADTDGDGSLDKQDDLAGFNCVSVGGVCTWQPGCTGPGVPFAGCTGPNAGTLGNLGDTTADDNCPVIANPGQANTDSQPDFTNSPNTPAGAIYRGDATNPHQDHEGDACDADIDNDGLSNLVEAGFLHPNLAPACARDILNTVCVTNPGTPSLGTLYCLSLTETKDSSGQLLASVGGSSTVFTSPTNPDSDSDGGLDGRECLFGSDPTSAAVGSCQPACGSPSPNDRYPAAVANDPDGDLLFPDAAETYYRTQGINVPGGGRLNDLEQVGSYRPPSPALVCTDPNAAVVCDNKVGNNDNDADADLLNDGVEVKWYGTSPANFDTDGDGCSDGREAADVNGDHVVNVVDLQAIAAHSNGTLVPGGPATAARPLGSALQVGGPYNAAGVRRDEVATYDVNKDGAISVLDLQLTAKLSGAPDSGKCQSLVLTSLQPQTAKPIVRSSK
jgi:hypothetical protein